MARLPPGPSDPAWAVWFCLALPGPVWVCLRLSAPLAVPRSSEQIARRREPFFVAVYFTAALSPYCYEAPLGPFRLVLTAWGWESTGGPPYSRMLIER